VAISDDRPYRDSSGPESGCGKQRLFTHRRAWLRSPIVINNPPFRGRIREFAFPVQIVPRILLFGTSD
jgi:hypothetical protein